MSLNLYKYDYENHGITNSNWNSLPILAMLTYRPNKEFILCDIITSSLHTFIFHLHIWCCRLDMSHWSLSTSSEESGAPRHTTTTDRREHTLVTITGGRGYVNLQQPCCTTITNNAHILLWEMKL